MSRAGRLCLEVPGLPVPEDEPHDAGLETEVGVGSGGGLAADPVGESARELHPGEEGLPGGIDRLGCFAPAAEHLVHEFAVLAEHLGGSERFESGEVRILIARPARTTRTR